MNTKSYPKWGIPYCLRIDLLIDFKVNRTDRLWDKKKR